MTPIKYNTLKIDTLEKFYLLFDQSASGFEMACREGCDDCCTCNVTATGLEMAFLFSHLPAPALEAFKIRLENTAGGKRYRPGMSTNAFARATLDGDPVEQEENDPGWGRCPLLEKGRCAIYDYRPFGCRSMMSETLCRDQGWAQMPPLALTVSTIFLQCIEHLDTRGMSGNFLDMADLYLSSGDAACFSFENIHDSGKKKIFIRNLEIPALMVPPEHRSQVATLVRELNTLMQAVV